MTPSLFDDPEVEMVDPDLEPTREDEIEDIRIKAIEDGDLELADLCAAALECDSSWERRRAACEVWNRTMREERPS